MTNRDPWEDEDEEEIFDEPEEGEPEADLEEEDDEVGEVKTPENKSLAPIVFGKQVSEDKVEGPHHQALRIEKEKRQRVFLQQLTRIGKVAEAAKLAGYKDSRAVYLQKAKNRAFSDAWDLAEKAFGDVVEAELLRRAIKGVEKDVWFKGNAVGTEVVYSDRLLLAAAKRFKKDEYADRSQVTSNTTVKVGIAVLPGKIKSDDWEKQVQVVHANQRPIVLEGDKVIDVTPEKGQTVELER